jgi:hypothetical protein
MVAASAVRRSLESGAVSPETWRAGCLFAGASVFSPETWRAGLSFLESGAVFFESLESGAVSSPETWRAGCLFAGAWRAGLSFRRRLGERAVFSPELGERAVFSPELGERAVLRSRSVDEAAGYRGFIPASPGAMIGAHG